MATHSSVLAWRIPRMAGPGGLLSMGSHRVRHDWSNLAAVAATWFIRTQEATINRYKIQISLINILHEIWSHTTMYYYYLAVSRGLADLGFQQGLNPGPLQWKHRVFIIGPSWKFLDDKYFKTLPLCMTFSKLFLCLPYWNLCAKYMYENLVY